MVLAAEEALTLSRDKTQEDLKRDRTLMWSLIKLVEIIGEAAAHISGPFRAEHPEIPWGPAIGMRNILVHLYFAVDLEVLWATVTEDLPALVSELRKILSP
jgi:uncharacterized protein with HEPN domain